jgi:hypothetical protein
MNLVESANKLRAYIGESADAVLGLKSELLKLKSETPEALANMMLAYRHLEDARMRLGKVIQAIEGGKSILDHPRVKALIAEIRSEAR